MELTKPLLLTNEQTNKVITSSGEFQEYISWKQSKDLAVGIGIHTQRFPKEGCVVSAKVDEAILLLSGAGAVVCLVDGQEQRFNLSEKSVVFIPKGTPFYFDPISRMEIYSSTGPAWTPKQQTGLDYRRKESGRMILQ